MSKLMFQNLDPGNGVQKGILGEENWQTEKVSSIPNSQILARFCKTSSYENRLARVQQTPISSKSTFIKKPSGKQTHR